jgi:hypothetical protein
MWNVVFVFVMGLGAGVIALASLQPENARWVIHFG